MNGPANVSGICGKRKVSNLGVDNIFIQIMILKGTQ